MPPANNPATPDRHRKPQTHRDRPPPRLAAHLVDDAPRWRRAQRGGSAVHSASCNNASRIVDCVDGSVIRCPSAVVK